MKKSLSTRLMYSFMTIIIIVVVGITAGISYLIADYFFQIKEQELAEKAGSRYLLVNLVARRARNIAAAAQAAGEPLDTKPVSMAIDEVYDGRLHPWTGRKPGP